MQTFQPRNYSLLRGRHFLRRDHRLVETFYLVHCTHCGKPLAEGSLTITEPSDAQLFSNGLTVWTDSKPPQDVAFALASESGDFYSCGHDCPALQDKILSAGRERGEAHGR